MLIIGICEDQVAECKMLSDMISRIMFDREDIKIQLYTSAEEIINKVEAGTFDCNLLTLDIHMPNVDGMALAHYLRKRQVDVDILFVTKSQEHIFEGYTCKAFGYILKPISQQRLQEELVRHLSELAESPECLNINTQGKVKRIPIADILYLESDKRKIIVHAKKQLYEFYEKMDIMEQILSPSGFVRCHQSYMIQKRYVQSFGRDGIEVNGVTIPVSRKYYDTLKTEL